MNIDERVQTLEKQNETFAGQIKNLKKMLGGVATLALAALIGGTALGVHAASYSPNGSFDVLTAKTLYLQDSSGKNRVSIYGLSGMLFLKDSRGKDRVVLNGSRGNLAVSDTNGKLRVYLNGMDGNSYLYDKSGKNRVKLDGANGNITATSISASHAHSYSSTSHKHTASSSNARRGVNRHSHKLTVK